MGCDNIRSCHPARRTDFNPRIPYGMRHALTCSKRSDATFQSTHPVWDATESAQTAGRIETISIHASRMGCDHDEEVVKALLGISIHASRMGCDRRSHRADRGRRISIHASRMGCDRHALSTTGAANDFNPRIPYGMRLTNAGSVLPKDEFQSTHPVWDATIRVLPNGDVISSYFNPRIPYGMRRHGVPAVIPDCLFQSTHPVWDAT